MCLECLDFRLSLSAADRELSSSSSSSRGTGNRSRRILGSGFTSTVTGFFGISSKFGKLANSSACNSGCGGGWGETPIVRMDGVLGLSCLLLCCNCLAGDGLCGIIIGPALTRELGDLSPGRSLETFGVSTPLLAGRSSLNEVIDGSILLFGECKLACGLL